MSGLTVTFINKQGIEVTIALFAFDKIHTSGDLTLSPTRIDGAEIRLTADRIIRYGFRTLAVTNVR